MSASSSYSGHVNRDSITWPELLAQAKSPDEVLQIALDYFASLTPQDIASLPDECVPPWRLVSPEEIVEYAFTLVRQRVSSQNDNTVLFRSANFFSHAARRVAELMSEAPQAPAANAGVGITRPKSPA